MKALIQTDTSALEYRNYVNKKFGEKDFDSWVNDQLDLKFRLKYLDVGCGVGKHLLQIALDHPTIECVGTDVSESSLERCKEKKIKNVKVLVSDHESLKETLKDQTFNRILSSYSIYYTKNAEKTFKDIYEVMKTEGVLFICGPHPENNKQFSSMLTRADIPFSKEFIEWSNFLVDTAKPLIKELFGNVEEIIFENPITFPDVETVFNYWRSTPHYFFEVEEVIKELVKEVIEKTGKFVINKKVIGLRAVKK